MTDIVERLRAKHDDSWPQQIGQGDLYNQDGPEAADEIERLRAGGCARDQHTTQFCGELRAAVKAENEACAKIADSWSSEEQRQFGNGGPAAAIRARMEAKP